jgi:hypothetical protein
MNYERKNNSEAVCVLIKIRILLCLKCGDGHVGILAVRFRRDQTVCGIMGRSDGVSSANANDIVRNRDFTNDETNVF